MKNAVMRLAIMAFLGWGLTRYIMNIQFERECTDYLKRAADASTIPIAIAQLDKAIKYMEANKLTEGSTHILYSSPDLDVGFWYHNLKSANENLKNLVNGKVNNLELIKLRGTILDHTPKGDELTLPKGISVYPFNLSFALWGVISLLIVALMCTPAEPEDDSD